MLHVPTAGLDEARERPAEALAIFRRLGACNDVEFRPNSMPG